ncbi:hypothetical protein SAMN05216428_101214 [Nitrosospira sp. Nsp11]|nr:hypothetical protein SAMN05216315_10129 [Nitrosospira sp. Nsp18]SHL14129.1 hypothetical protein SAMN05216428_101214 [Nitrosospira sp. Nsp11]
MLAACSGNESTYSSRASSIRKYCKPGTALLLNADTALNLINADTALNLKERAG